MASIKRTPLYQRWKRFRKSVRERFAEARDGTVRGDALIASRVSNDTAILKALVFLVERAQEEAVLGSKRHGQILSRLAEVRPGERPLPADVPPPAAELPARTLDTRSVELVTPELGLLAYLAPDLPAKTAVDVGAHGGEFSRVLLDAGLKVHALEPNPGAAARLRDRFAGAVRVHECAAGAEDGTGDLHIPVDRSEDRRYGDADRYSSLTPHPMPEDLPFERTARVTVRSLESLRRSGEVESEVGLLKVDAEGHDLDVLRGMGDVRPDLVVAEFWDPAIPFARDCPGSRLDEMVREMRRRGYARHLVIFRQWGDGAAAYFSGLGQSPEGSWGNVLFFRDEGLFERARRWCAGTLPSATFRAPAPF
ncbi:MAG TPA: FkbM family methyltransferase [Anaeromyxobacteraceae bacterium]|nr:FkbM family methyltransferase [Anaeromyxobacteraceae bacterium]